MVSLLNAGAVVPLTTPSIYISFNRDRAPDCNVERLSARGTCEISVSQTSPPTERLSARGICEISVSQTSPPTGRLNARGTCEISVSQTSPPTERLSARGTCEISVSLTSPPTARSPVSTLANVTGISVPHWPGWNTNSRSRLLLSVEAQRFSAVQHSHCRLSHVGASRGTVEKYRLT